MQRLVGLLGAKGAGKDTAASLLVQKLGFRRISFADALYWEVAEAFGVSIEFLGARDTKETSLPQLALVHCKDAQFIESIEPLFLTGRSRLALLRLPRSPRWIMQLWGTEYRRRSKYGLDSYWLDQVDAVRRTNPDTRFVIPDVRFKNEADYVQREGGILARVRRLALEEKEAQARAAGTATALHPSETELLSRAVDADLFNEEGDVNSLTHGLGQLLPELNRAA